MAEYAVIRKSDQAEVYRYQAGAPIEWTGMEFAEYNHVLLPEEPVPDDPEQSVPRRMTRLAFVGRLGEPAFVALLAMAKQSIEVEAMMKLIEWAQPDPDGTSIDLDDPRFQRLYQLEPTLVQMGVVAEGWANEVLNG